MILMITFMTIIIFINLRNVGARVVVVVVGLGVVATEPCGWLKHRKLVKMTSSIAISPV